MIAYWIFVLTLVIGFGIFVLFMQTEKICKRLDKMAEKMKG